MRRQRITTPRRELFHWAAVCATTALGPAGSVLAVATWLSTEEWFASLPTAYQSAGLIITDPADRLLVVKPNYRDGWGIPGGIVEHGEPPHAAAAREVAEELGLRIPAGKLLVVDWAGPAGPRPRAIVSYLFDGGTLADLGSVRLQEEELDAAEFVTWAEAEARMPAHIAARIPAAREARATRRTVYLPGRAGPADGPAGR